MYTFNYFLYKMLLAPPIAAWVVQHCCTKGGPPHVELGHPLVHDSRRANDQNRTQTKFPEKEWKYRIRNVGQGHPAWYLIDPSSSNIQKGITKNGNCSHQQNYIKVNLLALTQKLLPGELLISTWHVRKFVTEGQKETLQLSCYTSQDLNWVQYRWLKLLLNSSWIQSHNCHKLISVLKKAELVA